MLIWIIIKNSPKKSDGTYHDQVSTFTGTIYPPGYSGGQYGDDLYADHSNENRHHVYFFDGDMWIEGAIRGQVVFVASGDIFITGNITRHDALDTDLTNDLPGAGPLNVSSSTANQAVLIARGNIYIDNTFYSGTPDTQIIRALLMAPHGVLKPVAYSPTNIHNSLSLDFMGSMIFESIHNDPPVAEVFQDSRQYAYMDSLKTNPPPYLPSLKRILYLIKE